MTRVLHVVESFGGGVVSALTQYVSATPDLEHHLLRGERPDYADDGELAAFVSVRAMSSSPIRAAASVRRAVREIRPHVVHAHSSLAGALVRLTVARRKGLRIVYTPHGYAMDRRDVSGLTRRAFGLAEWALSWNTDVVAACSVREQEIADRGHAGGVVFVPNVAGSGLADKRTAPEPQRVVGVGRLAVQKDPEYFLAIVDALRARGVQIDPVWIGGGGTELADACRRQGVRVTGWLPRGEALNLIGGAALYLHTSARDAGPMTLLEAVAMGVPSVARRVPSLPGLPVEASANMPDEIAAIAQGVLEDSTQADRNLAAWREAFAVHTREEQRTRLRSVYAVPVGEDA